MTLQRMRRYLRSILMSVPIAGAVHAAGIPAIISFGSADEASEYLVARLKHLADDVDLSDPEAVRAALNIPFRSEESERIRPEDACSAPAWRDLRSLKAITAIASPSWYRTLSTGAGNVDVPQAFINPATRTGEPKFSYAVYRSVKCDGRERGEARVSFGGLPAYSCLTGATIQRLLPAASFMMATDGVHLYRYEGKRRNELSFNFRMGVSCAISADVRTPWDRR